MSEKRSQGSKFATNKSQNAEKRFLKSSQRESNSDKSSTKKELNKIGI